MVKTKTKRVFCVVLVLLLLAALWLLWGNVTIDVNKYIFAHANIPPEFAGFKVVQVSDLHNDEFGKSNKRLVRLIDKQEPDIIVITGDLVDSRRTDFGKALAFAEQIVKIAPVYYVTGNHEARLIAQYDSFSKKLEDMGVNILENEAVEIKQNGKSIALIGLHDRNFGLDFYDIAWPNNLKGSGNELFELMLAHRPQLLTTYEDLGADLVLSGHAHGGQVRIPFVGGVYAPNQGMLPKYDFGLYALGQTQMIVSRGLGQSIVPIRVNNRPELVVIELQHE